MAIITRSRVNRTVDTREPLPNFQEDISQVAYELFERRGRTHGRDQQDWFEAERIVLQRRRSGNGR